MSIIYDKNNSLNFCIQPDESNFGKKLFNFDQYIYFLNDEGYAYSDVNRDFCYTNLNEFDGVFIENNSNEFGVMLGHEFSPLIFRGQNKDYPNFVPTAKRYTADYAIQRCIDWVKKMEFLELFQNTPYFERCQKFQVLNCKFKFDLEAIAQHYDFMTNYLDISKDMLVSLFFAYTYCEGGKFYPISDFNKYSPTLYIGNLKNIYNHDRNCLKIIGFQALPRPLSQKAMAIEILNEDTFKPLFKKVELPKSYEFACQIYEKTNRGLNLFPQNDIMSKLAVDIKNKKTLDKKYIAEYCHNNNFDIKTIESKISEVGYNIENERYSINKNESDLINFIIDNSIIPYIDSKIGFRGVSAPSYSSGPIARY